MQNIISVERLQHVSIEEIAASRNEGELHKLFYSIVTPQKANIVIKIGFIIKIQIS